MENFLLAKKINIYNYLNIKISSLYKKSQK